MDYKPFILIYGSRTADQFPQRSGRKGLGDNSIANGQRYKPGLSCMLADPARNRLSFTVLTGHFVVHDLQYNLEVHDLKTWV